MDKARIRIDWNKHEVNINGKIVAVVDADGALTTFGEADQVKEEVESFMASWASRGPQSGNGERRTEETTG